MTLNLECPHAEYVPGLIIYCRKEKGPCAFQRYKPCKGWCVLTPGAKTCVMRKERDNEQGRAAAADSGDAV